MKTSILTALLVIGVVLLGAMGPTTGVSSSVTATSGHQTPIQSANPNNTPGAGLTGCWSFTGQDGDGYIMCCLDLWLFALCVSVNTSAIDRAVGSIF